MPRIGSVPTQTRVIFLLLAACMGTAQSCCTTPPNAEELLDLGYRSPRQAFQTLRAGIRGDLPRLEYRSLSGDFRRRNGLSQLSYREFREDWYSENPWIKIALSNAEVLELIQRSPTRVSLRVGALGSEILIDLVAEDFYQIWDGDELREDALVGNIAELIMADDGGWIARVPGDGPAPSELRLGREWKVDDIRQAGPADA
jgi:hypothetical protein